MTTGRTLPITAAATGMTFGLFYLMQALVASNVIDIKEPKPYVPIDFVLTQQPDKPVHERTRVDRPKQVKPPETKTHFPPRTETGTHIPTGIPPVAPSLPKSTDRIDLGMVDGEKIPIVRVEPQYPRRALERGIEGWAVVEFAVNADGQVENPVIIDAQPKGYFEHASLSAVSKFKYKPKVVDGHAVRSTGVRYRMTFTLGDDK
ncbi:energy transducer TonB [Kordiimonas marina]|uniref:energy transducer TonB n=1 Tax=Kordiimonas marina TaxID=2872312 RepID=UPI001FF4D069|nr:energy transducer TonB [Kordiimonas marina]MCJ9428435.1 TonB family protein [Kordiimonas marina]